MELLIGCGARHEKRDGLVTLDINPDHKPDVVWDLNWLPYPFEDNTFDSISAFEVLEHTGQQGDWRFFFAQFSEFWRILKPDGFLAGSSPDADSRWAWGDPGHTRVISPECFVFLDQSQYIEQIGKTPMTDYRFVYKADFRPVHLHTEAGSFQYVLQAVKRIT